MREKHGWSVAAIATVTGAGITAEGGVVGVGLVLSTESDLELSFPAGQFRNALYVLRAMNVRKAALVAQGYDTARIALAAFVEGIAVSLVRPYQLMSGLEGPAMAAARLIARTHLGARVTTRIAVSAIERALVDSDPMRVLDAVEELYGIAYWPA